MGVGGVDLVFSEEKRSDAVREQIFSKPSV